MSASTDRYEKAFDDYSIIMVKALADRLAEVILHHVLCTLRCFMTLPVTFLYRSSRLQVTAEIL